MELGKDNWDWIKAALGGDMSFDSFVNIPASIFKTQERLDQYIAFFEPQTSDKALERNILMGIKTIAARVNLIEKKKQPLNLLLKIINKKNKLSVKESLFLCMIVYINIVMYLKG